MIRAQTPVQNLSGAGVDQRRNQQPRQAITQRFLMGAGKRPGTPALSSGILHRGDNPPWQNGNVTRSPATSSLTKTPSVSNVWNDGSPQPVPPYFVEHNANAASEQQGQSPQLPQQQQQEQPQQQESKPKQLPEAKVARMLMQQHGDKKHKHVWPRPSTPAHTALSPRHPPKAGEISQKPQLSRLVESPADASKSGASTPASPTTQPRPAVDIKQEAAKKKRAFPAVKPTPAKKAVDTSAVFARIEKMARDPTPPRRQQGDSSEAQAAQPQGLTRYSSLPDLVSSSYVSDERENNGAFDDLAAAIYRPSYSSGYSTYGSSFGSSSYGSQRRYRVASYPFEPAYFGTYRSAFSNVASLPMQSLCGDYAADGYTLPSGYSLPSGSSLWGF